MRRLLILLVTTLLFSCKTSRTGHDLSDPRNALDTISHTGYTLLYSEKYEHALWVSYVLTREEALATGKRKDSFKQDPSAPHGSATNADYRKSGYDRGHLKPANDSKISKQEMADCFYLTNMSPQLPEFNRKIWKNLEKEIHSWGERNDSLHIVTGPIFKRRYKTIGENEVAIPSAYYKVVLSADSSRSIGFILAHEASKEPLESFALSVDSVETITGIDFFQGVEERIEASYDYSQWK